VVTITANNFTFVDRAAGGICRPTGNYQEVGGVGSMETDIFKDEEEAWGKYCSIAEWNTPVKTTMTGCKDACGLFQQPCIDPHRGQSEFSCPCDSEDSACARSSAYTYQYEDAELVGGWKGLGATRQVCICV